MNYPTITLGPLKIELLYPVRPIATAGWDRDVIETKITLGANGFSGSIQSQLDLAWIIALHEQLSALDRMIGQEGKGAYSLGEVTGWAGYLDMEFAVSRLGHINLEIRLCTNEMCETEIKILSEHDQSWLPGWLRKVREAIIWYLPDFDPANKKYPSDWWQVTEKN